MRRWWLAGTLLLALAAPAWAVDTSKEDLLLLQQQVDQAPQSPEAHFELAMGLARTIKLEAGYAELKKVSELDPAYPDKVIARYKPLVEQNGQNIEAHFRLAFGYYFKAFYLQQEIEAAKDDPAKATELTAQAADYRLLARKSFQSIVEADPKYVWGYNYLGYLWLESGDTDQAMATWRQAIAIEDNAVAHFLLGQALIRQGNVKDGLTETMTAMRMRGLNP